MGSPHAYKAGGAVFYFRMAHRIPLLIPLLRGMPQSRACNIFGVTENAYGSCFGDGSGSNRTREAQIHFLYKYHFRESMVSWCSWLSRQSNTLKVARSSLAEIIFFWRGDVGEQEIGAPRFDSQ